MDINEIYDRQKKITIYVKEKENRKDMVFVPS